MSTVLLLPVGIIVKTAKIRPQTYIPELAFKSSNSIFHVCKIYNNKNLLTPGLCICSTVKDLHNRQTQVLYNFSNKWLNVQNLKQNIYSEYVCGVCVCVCATVMFFWLRFSSSVPEFKVGPAITSQSHRAVSDMITINHSLWSSIEKHFLHHDWNAVVETKDAGPCPDWLQIAHQCDVAFLQ